MRQKVLLALLVVVTILAVAFRIMLSQHEPPVIVGTASPQLLTELQAMREAEQKSDARERCLAYPDPPGLAWDRSIVEAYCGLLSRKALSAPEIDAALTHGDTAQLQQAFDHYLQQNYENGQHGFLTAAIRKNFDFAERFELADRWVKADPSSAFALAARGTAYTASAWRARGSKFVSETPRENFERMKGFADHALVDLNEAVRRSPRLISAYVEMLEVAQMTSDEDLFSHALHRALALDPADQFVYDHWADSVEPKWGGSIAQVDQVSQRAMRHADENPLLKRMPARSLCITASLAEACRACSAPVERAKRSLELYREAEAIGPVACMINEAGNTAERAQDYEAVVRINSQAYRFSRDPYPLFRRALALQHLGQHSLALEDMDLAQRDYPDDIRTHLYRGWIDQEQHEPFEAEKAFLAATKIDRDNREATTELVNLYTTSLNQPARAKEIVDRLMSENPDNPHAWLLSAVLDHGKDDKHCKIALEKYLSLVDRNAADAYEQREIDRATARVAELTRLEQKTRASTTAQ